MGIKSEEMLIKIRECSVQMNICNQSEVLNGIRIFKISHLIISLTFVILKNLIYKVEAVCVCVSGIEIHTVGPILTKFGMGA
jgi:hypothetical protein